MTQRKSADRPAVFSRNWAHYLDEAVQIARTHPARLITFRSHVPWVTAQAILQSVGPVPIYFAAIEGTNRILYKARLREIVLRPRPTAIAARRLLRHRLGQTKHEPEWKDGVGTLYAISHCQRIRDTFSQTELFKLDGTTIHRRYSRSYCLVRVRPRDAYTPLETADDLGRPPRKVVVELRRIVRDTKRVRWLKTMYKNRCQICAKALRMIDGTTYSEGHHLKPLGDPHKGPDVTENIIIVCPNCHAACDLLGVRLAVRKLTRQKGHVIGSKYISYHNRRVEKKRSEVR
jgi:5-methylcytosine-specific restriction endonuclease McrA